MSRTATTPPPTDDRAFVGWCRQHFEEKHGKGQVPEVWRRLVDLAERGAA